jgi:tRNA A-37 threonylcarbamoyl transferase component Bud32
MHSPVQPDGRDATSERADDDGLATLIGRTFRGHRIERLIGAGGMGAVYLVRDETLPNVVKVLKVLLLDPKLDPAMRRFVEERFEREALMVSVLKHDNIVRVHSAGPLDGGGARCILMDYVEGQTLYAAWHAYPDRRIPPYRVFPIICHIARGLDAAHAQNIVHRDLKPANVMLCPKEGDPAFCMLLDFGTAKLTKPLFGGLAPTLAGMGIGTPSYMAVEQFRHADEATPLSDVYALAIVIWELVTGDLPWGRHDTSTPLGIAMLYELQRDRKPNAPPPGTLPAAWERALRSALSPNPDDRPPSVRHLAIDLAIGLEPVAGRNLRTGVEILQAIAPHFIRESDPDADTVRDSPRRTIVAAWPRSEPIRVAVASLPTKPDLAHRGPQPMTVAGSISARTPVLSAAPTTLGASNGVLVSRAAPSAWKLGILAVSAAALTTIGLFAVLNNRDQRAGSEVSPATGPNTSTVTPVPAASSSATITPIVPVHTSPQPTSTTSTATPGMPRGADPPTEPASMADTGWTSPPSSARSPTTSAGGAASGSLHRMPATPIPAAPAVPRAVTTNRPPSRASSTPTAIKKPSDERRGQKRKFDPDAPGGGVEE